jgi:hypothetical protein
LVIFVRLHSELRMTGISSERPYIQPMDLEKLFIQITTHLSSGNGTQALLWPAIEKFSRFADAFNFACEKTAYNVTFATA